MSDRSITIELPEKLLTQIDSQAQLMRTSRAETIVRILQRATDRSTANVEEIMARIEVLERQVWEWVACSDGKAIAKLQARVSALERKWAIDLSSNPIETEMEWMTVKEAFAWLGGDPNDPSSGVTSLDGRRSIGFHRFRVLKATDYRAFGLEFYSDRRCKQQPCLRPMLSSNK